MKRAREKNGPVASSAVAEEAAAVGVMVVAGAAVAAAVAVAISGGRPEFKPHPSADSCAGILLAQPEGHELAYPAVSRVIVSKCGVRGNMSNS